VGQVKVANICTASLRHANYFTFFQSGLDLDVFAVADTRRDISKLGLPLVKNDKALVAAVFSYQRALRYSQYIFRLLNRIAMNGVVQLEDFLTLLYVLTVFNDQLDCVCAFLPGRLHPNI